LNIDIDLAAVTPEMRRGSQQVVVDVIRPAAALGAAGIVGSRKANPPSSPEAMREQRRSKARKSFHQSFKQLARIQRCACW
jgi:hypothetical protein